MLIDPKEVPAKKGSNYPEALKKLVAGRSKKRVGDAAGLTNFGVNLVELEPGSWSSIRHWHLKQDEFIYIVEGEVTLVTNSGKKILKPVDMAAFPAGEVDGHHLINHSNSTVTYLEIGDQRSCHALSDRTDDERVIYPDEDLVANYDSGEWQFSHKDGRLY